MEHLTRVQTEFTRQADTFDAYAPQADLKVEERFQHALGASPGRVLDLACGPGVVTAAVAGVASEVVGLDATPAMLEKAEQRCEKAGLTNVSFHLGDAELLPFENGAFDAVVTRLAIHHFAAPETVLREVGRILRDDGVFVIADVVVSEDAEEAALQNAIENIRDPSHVRMMPLSELLSLVETTGFLIKAHGTWDKAREFEEWMGIANDPRRAASLRVVARTLAFAGQEAGMGLSIANDKLVFFHRWTFITARKAAQ